MRSICWLLAGVAGLPAAAVAQGGTAGTEQTPGTVPPAGPAAASPEPVSAPAPTLAAQPTPRTAPPAAAEEDEDEGAPDIVVTGSRRQPGAVIGDIPPEQQLSPADIRSYGVGSITELLAELTPQTTSGRGAGGGPVILLNGRRISGFQEIRDLPTEAIARVDILPEEVALKYGYRADQRVVNFVLRRRFRAVTAELNGRAATEGGQQQGGSDNRPFWQRRQEQQSGNQAAPSSYPKSPQHIASITSARLTRGGHCANAIVPVRQQSINNSRMIRVSPYSKIAMIPFYFS